MREEHLKSIADAVDRILDAPSEEDCEPPPRKHRHPQDFYGDWPSNEQCEAFKRGWR